MERFLLTVGVVSVGLVLTLAGPRAQPRQTTITPAMQVPQEGGERYHHPAEAQTPELIEQYDKRYLDGHYEYRYVLSNGDTRYERAYWLPVGNRKVLARKGYYSYPLPNRQFLTVFYTADQNGYQQDSSVYSQIQPVLPRALEVPEYDPPAITTTTAEPSKKMSAKQRVSSTPSRPNV